MTDTPASADEIVYPPQITNDFLFTFLNDAYFKVRRDDVGDLYLKDVYTLWLFPQDDGEQIRLMVRFASSDDRSREMKLEYVNRINDGYKSLRAYLDSSDGIGFDYYIPVDGGIGKRNIVLSIRRFLDYVRTALQNDTEDVLR